MSTILEFAISGLAFGVGFVAFIVGLVVTLAIAAFILWAVTLAGALVVGAACGAVSTLWHAVRHRD